jgi:hypothetical protein
MKSIASSKIVLYPSLAASSRCPSKLRLQLRLHPIQWFCSVNRSTHWKRRIENVQRHRQLSLSR